MGSPKRAGTQNFVGLNGELTWITKFLSQTVIIASEHNLVMLSQIFKKINSGRPSLKTQGE